MTTDPEPLSAGAEAAIRSIAFSVAPDQKVWFPISDLRALLATLDEARATPSGDLAAALRDILLRALLDANEPGLDVERLAWAVFYVATDGMGVDPDRPSEPDATDREYAAAIAREYAALCHSGDTPRSET